MSHITSTPHLEQEVRGASIDIDQTSISIDELTLQRLTCLLARPVACGKRVMSLPGTPDTPSRAQKMTYRCHELAQIRQIALYGSLYSGVCEYLIRE